jgi:RHS repeat-associated protein
MKQYLTIFSCLLILLTTQTYAKDQDISTLDINLSAESEPSLIVADCVNVSSGTFFQVECDLIGNTIDPLRITRFFDSRDLSCLVFGAGWGSQFPLTATNMQNDSKKVYIMFCEHEGALIPYRGKSIQSGYSCQIDPRIYNAGYTNLKSEGISGKNNFVNWKAEFSKMNGWTVTTGDGSERRYTYYFKLTPLLRYEMQFPTEHLLLLTEELKANGNKRFFEYDVVDNKPCLSKISTKNTEGKKLNEIKFNYSKGYCSIQSSCGKHVEYIQRKRDVYIPYEGSVNKKVLDSSNSDLYGLIQYKYSEDARIEKILKPQGRYLEISYDKKARVESIKEPIGTNGLPISTFTFQYEGNKTKVLNAANQQTIYNFDKNKRLRNIETFDQNQLVKKEIFEWSVNGWLKSKGIGASRFVSNLQEYEYDCYGNVISKTIYGNLTGEMRQESFSPLHKDQVDQYTIQYEYSNDERNLLIKKTTQQGFVIFYHYLHDRNLCFEEFRSYNGVIKERIFRTYDSNGQLQSIIEDDGSAQNESLLNDVTYRKIKKIYAVTKEGTAAFGKPEKTVESYLDLKNKKLVTLNRTEFSYDQFGNEILKRVYDGQNIFCYETKKTFDEHQRLIEECNALGQTSRYVYDENNNKIEEELIGSGKITQYVYDLGNRLIGKIEKLDDGKKYSTQYSYNVLNQLISEVDNYGNETNYEYDRLGHQTKIIKPMMIGLDGNIIRPTFTKYYNAVNQIVKEKDENDIPTIYCRNAYGDPIQINYSDGAQERFVYYPCGWLKQKWLADGTSTQYVYDPKGQITKQTTLDKDGNIIKQEEFSYKGTLLMYKKDAMGLVTKYEYDGAGRKILESIGDIKIIRYKYDDFGRLISVIKVLSVDEERYETFKYDWLDRVTEKTLQDGKGNIFSKENYEYDVQGNQILKKVWQSEDTISLYQSKYDARGNLLWKEDSLGNRQTFNYEFDYLNELGQCVLRKTILDELGRPTIEIFDALHRIVKKEIFENDILVSSTRFDYDPSGQVVRQQAQVMVDGKPIREYSLVRTYNKRGLLSSETELPHGKTIKFIYDKNKRLIQKEKPDGISLIYTYDFLGRIDTLKSSDDTIFYQYCYDLHDNAIKIIDFVNSTDQKLMYDVYDRLLHEEISPGVTLQYEYDKLDRLIKMTLPDHSYVTYHYNPIYLDKIQRYSTSNELKYECDHFTYDMKGNILGFVSPVDHTNFSYDLLNRNVGVRSTNYKSNLKAFDPIGNLLEESQIYENDSINAMFLYDRFNNLIDESAEDNHLFKYDSLGNCVTHNERSIEINTLNQVVNDEISQYSYDQNGNLIKQTNPNISYVYDAFNRLIKRLEDNKETSFVYDAFGRCLHIIDENCNQQLIYQKDQEIGCVKDSKICEFRLLHPEKVVDKSFVLEFNDEIYFPIQDNYYNISAIQNQDGRVVQYYKYTSFGEKKVWGELSIVNPWGFANRRDILGLTLFSHRFYNPKMMRWLSPDPLGFRDGLNLYLYNHNNPYYYRDPDGCFAFVLPLLTGIFGSGLALTGPTIAGISGATVGFLVGVTIYEVNNKYDSTFFKDDEDSKAKGKNKKKYYEDNFPGTDADLEKNPDWRETTHPNQRANGHREFENLLTGDKIRFDQGKPHKYGHGTHDHYHRFNDDYGYYYDCFGNPTPEGSDASHLYPPEGIKWSF